MIIIIFFCLTYMLGAIMSAILVGLALGGVLLRRGTPGPPWMKTLGVIACFAFFDMYMVPILRLMDISMTIGNPEVARILDATDAIKSTDLMAIRWYHVLIWLIQLWIARRAAMWVCKYRPELMRTSASSEPSPSSGR